jgi:DNA-binding HxlR family transcriptional regulator
VLEEGEDSASWYELGYCVARVPDGTSPNHKLIAKQMAARSTSRLLSNSSLDFALGNVEGGRDKLAGELQASGQNISRDQVAHSLRALESFGTISRSGQLKSHLRPERVWKKVSGALTYKIHVTFAVLGDLEAKAYTWLSKHTTPCATVGVALRTRRIEGCLRHACETAQEGLRNHKGYWLTRRCIDIGLTEPEAEKIIKRFQKTVARIGHRYTRTEAMKTVRSAYKHHG